MATTVKELVATFGLETDKASFNKGQQAVDQIKSAAKTLVTLFAAGAVARGFASMIGSASDAAEAMNVIDAAFGENKEAVLDWAKTTADAVGRSEFELRDMAATVGALVQPMLKNRKAAADMSTQMAELAVDLGSFFNATDEEALQALKSGLVGSTEPLLRFGVNLQVAQLEAFALSNGITKSFKAMSIAEKTSLRYQAILEQTANAQGDAAKTADGYANAIKAVRAAIKDVITRIGGAFLPGVERAIRRIKFLVRSFNNWIDVNKEIINSRIDRFMERLGRVFESLFLFMERLVRAVGDWFFNLSETQMMLMKIVGAAALLAAILLLPGGSILLLLGLIALLIDDFEVWRAGGESVIGDLLGRFDTLESRFSGIAAALYVMKAAWDFVFDAIGMMAAATVEFIIDLFRVGLVGALDRLGTTIIDIFSGIFSKVGEVIKGAVELWKPIIANFISESVASLEEVPILGKIVKGIGGIAGAAGTLAGGGSAGEAVGAFRSKVNPRGSGSNINNQQSSQVNVNLNVPPGMNEEQLSQMVADKVDEKQTEQNRTTLNALTAGAAG